MGLILRCKSTKSIDMEQNEKKSGRGGARPGAGRKKMEGGKRVRASFMFSDKAAANLEAAAEAAGVSRNEWLNALLESLPL